MGVIEALGVLDAAIKIMTADGTSTVIMMPSHDRQVTRPRQGLPRICTAYAKGLAPATLLDLILCPRCHMSATCHPLIFSVRSFLLYLTYRPISPFWIR